jgi:hypothetical protein
MIKIKKSQWEVESMFDETFENFITELKKGEYTESLKSSFQKSIYLSKLLHEISMDNAKTALEHAFMGVLSEEESIEMIQDYDEE